MSPLRNANNSAGPVFDRIRELSTRRTRPQYGDVTPGGFKYGCWDCEDGKQHASHLPPPRVRDLTMCPTCGRGESQHEHLDGEHFTRVKLCETRNGHLANALRYHERVHPGAPFTAALQAERERRDREGWHDGKPTPLISEPEPIGQPQWHEGSCCGRCHARQCVFQ